MAAATVGKTDTFLGERYRRIARRRGKLKALVATARSILLIVWHLLANRAARYRDLGPAWYASRIDKDRKIRSHVRQLEALGYAVTLAPGRLNAAANPAPLRCAGCCRARAGAIFRSDLYDRDTAVRSLLRSASGCAI